jgi:hypothetical protein
MIVVATYTIDAIDPVEITFETAPDSGVEVLIGQTRCYLVCTRNTGTAQQR